MLLGFRVIGAFGALLVVLSWSNTASSGESLNGHEFISLCSVVESDHDSERRFAECERFIADLRQKLSKGPVHGDRACIPDDVFDIQLLIAGVAVLSNDPPSQNKESHDVLASLYAERWPCRD